MSDAKQRFVFVDEAKRNAMHAMAPFLTDSSGFE
jgi:hypothetical protein